MRIAYYTTDEVNIDLALQMADVCGATLYLLPSSDVPPPGRFNAALYDWDALSLYRRQEILLESLASLSSCPVAVHGYNLEEEEVETLHQDGVAVFDCLDPEVFQTLRRLSRPNGRRQHGKHWRRREPVLHWRRELALHWH
jgi:hypothetical protein